MKNLVSVIIPVYNIEFYIERCIKSVLAQTYTNTEIILVDNNSTDGSRLICERYAHEDNRIILINEKTQGLGPARDRGINSTKGEWICFVDGDDCIHPQYIEMLLKTVTENNCLSCQCRYKKIYEDDIEDSYIQDIDYADVRLMSWRKYFLYIYQHATEGHTPFGVWCNIYHHSLFEGIRFGNLRFAEDSAFTPRIIYAAREKKVAVIDSVLYFYFQREGSLLNSAPSMIRLDRFYAKKGAMEFWKSKGEEEMYALFFPDYFNCLVKDYTELCAEFQHKEERFQFIKDEINALFTEEQIYFSTNTIMHFSARECREKIAALQEVIVYGSGECGKELIYWLPRFGIRIIEVWDQKYKEARNVDGIVYAQAHRGYAKDIPILILIENRFVMNEVHYNLREMGYQNITGCRIVQEAVKYWKYDRYLPNLIENYRRIL